AQNHHERWDGDGYPVGLGADAIPAVARATAVADVFDALTHDRPYRPAWTTDDAIAYVGEQSGSPVGPEMVAAFMARPGRILELCQLDGFPAFAGRAEALAALG